MQIDFRTTAEISIPEWESYTVAFNQVFEKDYAVGFFSHKYQLSIDAQSYHVLLKEESRIVGGCTVIPYEYYLEGKINRCGLAVDVFILPEFRSDPLALYRMYKLLKKELIQRDIALVIAVPNDMARPYWKNVVKWKDVGCLNYYALPLKMANVIAKMPKLFNPLSQGYAWMMIFLSRFIFSTASQLKISINRSDKIIEKQRYTEDHLRLVFDNTSVSYRIVDEEGIITCYLIDFYNLKKGRKDAASLRKAIRKIMSTESIDLIIFVGKLNFLQLLLFKVPFKLEPKHLYLMTDLLIPENINTALISDIKNWDFGLFNYDVR